MKIPVKLKLTSDYRIGDLDYRRLIALGYITTIHKLDIIINPTLRVSEDRNDDETSSSNIPSQSST